MKNLSNCWEVFMNKDNQQLSFIKREIKMVKRVHECYPYVKDCYLFDESGKVWNENTKHVLATSISFNGYPTVSVQKIQGGVSRITIHRLLMIGFKPVENMQNLQVNHIDGNKKNNNLDNLEWCTSKENIQHAIKTGLTNFDYLYGEGTNFSHYTEQDALKVLALLKTNEYTDKDIENITGLPARSFISRIRRGETWKYLTKDITTPLGKAQRPSTFNKKSSTTISKESTSKWMETVSP